MTRTILADVTGFTPIIDDLAIQYGLVRAAVFGRIWRFCQMEDGVCKASLDTIAQGLGIDKATVMRHAESLVEDGYLKDITPDLRNRPHIYADTGKASIRIGIGATVAQRNATVAGCNADVAQCNATVAESQLNKVFKKDIEERSEDTKQRTPAELLTIIDTYLHQKYNGTYSKVQPVVSIGQSPNVVTIGVSIDQPALKAEIASLIKPYTRTRYTVKVVKVQPVTSSADLSAQQVARLPYQQAYERARGGPYRWADQDDLDGIDWLISVNCPPDHVETEYKRNASDQYWQGKQIPFSVIVKNYRAPVAQRAQRATQTTGQVECYT